SAESRPTSVLVLQLEEPDQAVAGFGTRRPGDFSTRNDLAGSLKQGLDLLQLAPVPILPFQRFRFVKIGESEYGAGRVIGVGHPARKIGPRPTAGFCPRIGVAIHELL